MKFGLGSLRLRDWVNQRNGNREHFERGSFAACNCLTLLQELELRPSLGWYLPEKHIERTPTVDPSPPYSR